MHEIGVVRSMCKTVVDFMHENNIERISEIVCEIGELSQIIPQYVTEVYAPVRDEVPELAGVELIIETVPGMAECDDCDEIFNVVENKGYCPNCGSFDKSVLTGTEFNIKEIHIPEEDK